jgi:hypothetical protein
MPTTMASIERLRATASVTSIIKWCNFSNGTSDIPGQRVTNQRIAIPCTGVPGFIKVNKITIPTEIRITMGQSQDRRGREGLFIVWPLLEQ